MSPLVEGNCCLNLILLKDYSYSYNLCITINLLSYLLLLLPISRYLKIFKCSSIQTVKDEHLTPCQLKTLCSVSLVTLERQTSALPIFKWGNAYGPGFCHPDQLQRLEDSIGWSPPKSTKSIPAITITRLIKSLCPTRKVFYLKTC